MRLCTCHRRLPRAATTRFPDGKPLIPFGSILKVRMVTAQGRRWWGARAWERCVATPLAGRRREEAEWVTVGEHEHLRFISRHGVLFEDNRGALAFHYCMV